VVDRSSACLFAAGEELSGLYSSSPARGLPGVQGDGLSQVGRYFWPRSGRVSGLEPDPTEDEEKDHRNGPADQ
jgi:hypothetical protein